MDIPQPVGLLVSHIDSTRHATPPSAGEAKTIARHLRRWLLDGPRYIGESFVIGELRFLVGYDISGVTAALGDPTPGGSTTADQILDAVRHKVSKYRTLAKSGDADLIVAIGGAPDSAISAGLVRDTIAGKNSTTISFSPFASGPVHTQIIKMRPDGSPPKFDACLTAVAWIDTNDELPSLALCPVQTGERTPGLLTHPRLRQIG